MVEDAQGELAVPSKSVRAAYVRRMLKRLAEERIRIVGMLENDPGNLPLLAVLRGLDEDVVELTEESDRLASEMNPKPS